MLVHSKAYIEFGLGKTVLTFAQPEGWVVRFLFSSWKSKQAVIIFLIKVSSKKQAKTCIFVFTFFVFG